MITDRFTEKLQTIPGTVQDFPGDVNNKDSLLYFLAENSQEPSLPKMPDEKLADILIRNLYKPQPMTSWSHLIGENRILENACRRPELWEMVNAIMHVSPSLLGIKVASATALHAEAHNNSLGVSSISQARKRRHPGAYGCPNRSLRASRRPFWRG